MDPYRQIADIVVEQAKKAAGNALSGIPCELGTITASGLKLDTFKYEIPNYLVAEWMAKIYLPAHTMLATETAPVDSQGSPLPGATTVHAKYDFETKEIDQVKIEIKPDLQPGDRVLAIPVNGGQDAVVICKVVPNA